MPVLGKENMKLIELMQSCPMEYMMEQPKCLIPIRDPDHFFNVNYLNCFNKIHLIHTSKGKVGL